MKYLFICSFLNKICAGISIGGFLGSFDGSFFDGGDFVGDHGAHWVDSDSGGFTVGVFFDDGLGVDDWLGWSRVLGGISDNGGISFDSGEVHWDFIFFLLLDWSSSSFLSFWLFGISFLGVSFLSVGFNLSFFLNLSFGLFLDLCFNGSISLSKILIFAQIGGQVLHEIIRELGSKLNGISCLSVEQSNNNKC